MPHTQRIGIQIDHDDPFWVQVRELIWRRAQALPVELVEIAVLNSQVLAPDARVEVVENIIVQGLDALICNTFHNDLLSSLLERGLPIVYVSESTLRHPRFVSRAGLYDAGVLLGRFVAGRLSRGNLLVVGGLCDGEDRGQSRLDGFVAGLGPASPLALWHAPAPWREDRAAPALESWLRAHPDLRIDAIYGLSDPLALCARAVCQAAGRLGPTPLVVGVNGDPLALAAVNTGLMAATVETDVDDIAAQAVELAFRAARGERLPPTFAHRQHLVTADNVADSAVRKLMSLAELPSRLVGLNHHNKQQRITQLETSLAINQQIGQILDQRRLALAITALIRDSYGFDQARFLRRAPESGALVELGAETPPDDPCDPAGPLAYALARDQAVFIPDVLGSARFPRDPRWPALRARAVVPVHFGGAVVGLLDLHAHRPAHYPREALDGLQVLANQLGVALRNAELYSEAVVARGLAEQADRLKTALLANVSHELRTPLTVILGYSRVALEGLADSSRADGLAHGLTQIRRSGEHLLRLINDLLDLSRAEIGELAMEPDRVEPGRFIEEVFRSSADNFAAEGIVWGLTLAPGLPPIEADPVRLRQVLFNLLHNAAKFTGRGSVTLGAEVDGSELHIWVADTGPGIPEERREQIFEPFVSTDTSPHGRGGIGLGLAIARRLVLLHHGRLDLESAPGAGSTFHVRLPLPDAEPKALRQPDQVLAVVSDAERPPAALTGLAERCGLPLLALRPAEGLLDELLAVQPALLAWDLAQATAGSLALLERLRAHPQLSQIPLVVRGAESEAAAPTGGLTGVALKPLPDSTLLATLQQLDPGAREGCILIVEDDPHLRAAHRRLAAAQFPGYRICAVADGSEAMRILADTTPRLVLLDLALPEVDGFAVLGALRANPRTAGVPVLVLSGKSLAAEDIRRLAEARAVFQPKEILSGAELAKHLQRTIDGAARLPPHTSTLVKQAVAYIQQRYGAALSRQEIADAVGVHKDYLGRIFQQELGLSPWEFLIRYRLLQAKQLLRDTDLSVAEVAAQVGFDTPAYFSQVFHREVGCSPRAFRAQEQG